MKPSLSIDERGVLLHVTNDAGEGVALPLNEQTVAQVVETVDRVLSPEGKRRLLRGLGRLFLELTAPEKDDGK